MPQTWLFCCCWWLEVYAWNLKLWTNQPSHGRSELQLQYEPFRSALEQDTESLLAAGMLLNRIYNKLRPELEVQTLNVPRDSSKYFLVSWLYFEKTELWYTRFNPPSSVLITASIYHIKIKRSTWPQIQETFTEVSLSLHILFILVSALFCGNYLFNHVKASFHQEFLFPFSRCAGLKGQFTKRRNKHKASRSPLLYLGGETN